MNFIVKMTSECKQGGGGQKIPYEYIHLDNRWGGRGRTCFFPAVAFLPPMGPSSSKVGSRDNVISPSPTPRSTQHGAYPAFRRNIHVAANEYIKSGKSSPLASFPVDNAET